MEVIQNNSQECGANLPENTSKWRTWDNDFIEIEEVNTLRALVNARSEDPPHSFRSNGRGRIKLDLGECTLPILKANTYQLPSLSTVLLRQKSPNTGKYCKVIGRGRGRGRHTQMSQMELGHNVEKEIDKQRSRASCHSNDGPKNIEDNKGNNMKVNQSPNALKVQCQNHGQETVIDCIKSLEEPDRWILIDGMPEKEEERKELLSTIEAFGVIESISYHNNNKALIRMSKMFDCEWIISCLNDNQISPSSNTVRVSRATDFLDG